MRPLPSPSSCTSSPSSTVSFYAHMLTGSKGASAAGCLAAILRRILCSRGLPTHPSDQITSSGLSESFKQHESIMSVEKVEATDASPGIVASLMGLDCLPDTISGCQSMNSSVFNEGLSDQGEEHRKRVYSSSSIREIPSSFKLENEYIVLNFENADEKKKARRKARKSNACFGESKGKEGEKADEESVNKMVSRLLFDSAEDGTHSSRCGGAALQDANGSHQGFDQGRFDGEELGKREINVPRLKKEEHECSSDNSSPVSVLNFEEDRESAKPNSRRRLSSELDDFDCNCAAGHGGSSSSRVDYQNSGKCCEDPSSSCRKRTYHGQNYTRLQGEFSGLADDELVGSNWIYNRILHHRDLEDISAELELGILSQLIEELVSHFA